MKVNRHRTRQLKLFCCLFVLFGSVHHAFGQFQGVPASDILGAEDIWGNPTFVGGVVNGGPTAHSEF